MNINMTIPTRPEAAIIIPTIRMTGLSIPCRRRLASLTYGMLISTDTINGKIERMDTRHSLGR